MATMSEALNSHHWIVVPSISLKEKVPFYRGWTPGSHTYNLHELGSWDFSLQSDRFWYSKIWIWIRKYTSLIGSYFTHWSCTGYNPHFSDCRVNMNFVSRWVIYFFHYLYNKDIFCNDVFLKKKEIFPTVRIIGPYEYCMNLTNQHKPRIRN